MSKVLIFSILFSFAALAESEHPAAPEGWVEMASLDPVVVTWVKADPEKKLEELPTVMVQAHQRSAKINSFLEKHANEKCFDVDGNGWKQTWCPKKDEVFVLLSKGNASDVTARKEQLMKWVLSHD